MSASGTVARLQARLGLNRQEFSSGLRAARTEADQFGSSLQASFSRLRGVLGLTVAGVGLATVVRGIRSAVSELSNLGKAARDAGQDVEELQGLQRGFSRNARVSTEEVTRAFVDFNARVGQAANGQGDLARVVQRYGIELRGANGQMRSQSELLREIAERIRRARSESERGAIGRAAFGEAGLRMAQAMAGGADAINDMVNEARAAGDIIDRNLIHRAEILDDKFAALTSRVKTFFQALAVGALAGGAETAQDTLVRIFGSLERARMAMGDGAVDTLLAEMGELSRLSGVEENLDRVARSIHQLRVSAGSADTDLSLLGTSLLLLGETDAQAAIAALSAELAALIRRIEAGEEPADVLSAALTDIADRAIQTVSEVRAIDGVQFGGVIGRLQGLVSQLRVVQAEAGAAATELSKTGQPGAISRGLDRLGSGINRQRFATEEARMAARTREQIALERELELVQRRARDAGVTLTRAQAEAQAQLNLQLAAAANPARERAGGGSQTRPNEYASAVASIREQTEALELEAAALIAVAASGVEYADAIEFARRQAELLHAAQRAGLAITPELEAEISALAEAYVTAGQTAGEAAAHMENVRNQSERWAQNMTSHFDGLITSGKGLSGFLTSIARQLESRGWQALFGALSGGGTGGGGGLLSGLIGLLGGGGGGVRKYDAGGRIAAGALGIVAEKRDEFVNGHLVRGPANVIGGAETARMMQGGGARGGSLKIGIGFDESMGGFKASVMDENGRMMAQAFQQFSSQVLPARMQQISRDPRRRG